MFLLALGLSGCGETMASRTGTWAASGDLAVLGGGTSERIDGWVVGFAVARAKGKAPRTVYAWVAAQPELGKDAPSHASVSDSKCQTDGRVGSIEDSLRSGDAEFRLRAEVTCDPKDLRLDDVVQLDGKPTDLSLGRVFLIDLRGTKRTRQLVVDIPAASISESVPDQSQVDSAAYAKSLRALLVANPEVTAFFAGR